MWLSGRKPDLAQPRKDLLTVDIALTWLRGLGAVWWPRSWDVEISGVGPSISLGLCSRDPGQVLGCSAPELVARGACTRPARLSHAAWAGDLAPAALATHQPTPAAVARRTTEHPAAGGDEFAGFQQPHVLLVSLGARCGLVPNQRARLARRGHQNSPTGDLTGIPMPVA